MLTCLLCVLLVLLIVLPAGAETLPVPARETFTCSWDGSRWPYLVQLPPQEPQAVLVYLHGHYSDEVQGMAVGTYNDAFGKLRRECLSRNWAYVTAWYGGNSWLGPVAEAGLADLLGVLRKRWPGKPVYLCGGSMGGTSTLIFAQRRPELLAGALALCPASDIASYYHLAAASATPVLQNIAAAIRLHYTAGDSELESELALRSALDHAARLTMPLYVAHGDADALIPIGPTRDLVQRLRALGRRVRYVEIAGGDHDAPVVQINWSEALDFVSAAVGDQRRQP